jgi:hypothetical protein
VVNEDSEWSFHGEECVVPYNGVTGEMGVTRSEVVVPSRLGKPELGRGLAFGPEALMGSSYLVRHIRVLVVVGHTESVPPA